MLHFSLNWYNMVNKSLTLGGGCLLKITSVNIRRIEKEGSRMKAIASVLIDDGLAIHDIRIIEGDNGLFIAMPSRKTATGGYRDIAHPINQDIRRMFEEEILTTYENESMHGEVLGAEEIKEAATNVDET
jgi:stage V sporulation protein G